MASRKQKKVSRYVEEGSVLKLKAYLRKHRGLALDFSARKGRTPLHLACALQDDAMVRLLLKHGADALRQDHRGNTALHVAAKQAAANGEKHVHDDLLVPLRKHGPAAMNVANRAGKTPQDLLPRGNAEKPAASSWGGGDPAETFKRSEEEEFRAKLFGECMDEYQESFGQYDDDYCRSDPEPETHFAWAERMSREYSRKRHQANPTLRAKAAATAEKERREQQQQEFTRRLEEEHRQYQQRAHLLREELKRGKKHQYERRCASVFAKDSSSPRLLRYQDIPWPCRGGGVEDMIAVITHGVDAGDQQGYRSYLRRQQALWHPDKFQQRCGARLEESDRQHVLDTVMALSQRLNKLAADSK